MIIDDEDAFAEEEVPTWKLKGWRTPPREVPLYANSPMAIKPQVWVPCPGECGAMTPPGQRCFDCAIKAVAEWKAQRIELASKHRIRLPPGVGLHVPKNKGKKKGGPT